MIYKYNDFFYNIFVFRSRGAEANANAEIIPVEPDQDNACAGKATDVYTAPFLFL
jgi:hypothetical protein